MARFAAMAPYTGPDTVIRVYQMPAEEIGYLTSLVEAHDGIGLVRTLDQARGIVELWMMPELVADFERLLEALRAEFAIQEMPAEFD